MRLESEGRAEPRGAGGRCLEWLFPGAARRALSGEALTLEAALVGLGGLALGGLTALSLVVTFPLHEASSSRSGVVSWAAVNGYPESSEAPWYALIVALLVLAPLACVSLWLRVSSRQAMREGGRVEDALRSRAPLFALTALPALFLGLVYARWAPLLLVATLAAIALGRWIPGARLSEGLLGAPRRLPASAVALAGCAFGAFLPMAAAPGLAPWLALLWWIWPLAFVALWLSAIARAPAPERERAALGWALAAQPALLMLAQPPLIDFPAARRGLLAATVALLCLAAWAGLRGTMVKVAGDSVRVSLRLLRLVTLMALGILWLWEPDLPGVLVEPGDGDHLLAFLNEGLHGRSVYRDFWYPYGPLFYLLDLVSARLNGLDRYYYPSFFVTVSLTVLLLGLTVRRVYLTWPFRALGPLFLVLAWTPQPVQFRVWAGYFVVVAAVGAASLGRARLLPFAGALGGLAFLFSHEAAIAGLVGLQAGLLWTSRRGTWARTVRCYAAALLRLAAGLAAVLIPAALVALRLGLLRPYLHSTLGFMAVNDECCSLPLPSLWDALPPGFGLVAGSRRLLDQLIAGGGLFGSFYFPVAVCVAALLYVLGRPLRSRAALPQDAVLVGLAAFGLLMFRMAVGRSDEHHAIFCSLPALALALALAERLWLRLRALLGPPASAGPPRRQAAEMALVGAGVLFLAWGLRLPRVGAQAAGAFHKLRRYHSVEHRPRPTGDWTAVVSSKGERFYFPDPVAARIEIVLDHLRANTRPDEGVYAFPYAFRYGVLLDRPSPLAFGVCLWGAAARPVDRRRLVRELQVKHPRYLIYEESQLPDVDGVPTGDRYPEVADFIFSHYDVERDVAGAWILRWRGAAQPPAPSTLEVARPELRGYLKRGWYYAGPELGGDARWTSTTATARLTRLPEHTGLFVDALVSATPGAVRQLSASLDGQPLGRFGLSPAGETRLRFPLPPSPESGEVELRLEVDRPLIVAPMVARLGLVVRRLGFD